MYPTKPRLRKEARKAPGSLEFKAKRMAELPKDIGPMADLGLFTFKDHSTGGAKQPINNKGEIP